MQKTKDRQLLQTVRRNPQEGLEEILALYGGTLQALVRRILQDPRDAEECLSDVLVQCWRMAERLEEQEINLKGWLIVTARNKAIDQYRRLRKEAAVPLPEDFELMAEELLESDRSEAEDLMADLVDELEAPDREIFIRRYYGLQSSREIGRALQMEEHAVNVRLSRGRARLKQRFLKRFGKECSNEKDL